MKTNIILATLAVASLTLTSCSNDSSVLDLQEVEQTKQKAHVRLAITTSLSVTTRAALTANDRPLTDLYILDYMNGTLQQVLHQTSTAADFAEPDLTLDYGEHTLRVIATRSTSPRLTDALGNQWQHTPNELCAVAPGATENAPTLFTATKQLDTFAASETVTVAAGQHTAVSITLQRIVAQLVFNLQDVMPTDCNTIDMAFTEHDQLSLATLAPSAHAITSVRIIDVTSKAGTTGVSMGFYMLAPEEGYTTDITVTMTSRTPTPLAQFTLTAVPLARNKITTVSGYFYNHHQSMTMSINDTWDSEGHDITL